MIYVHEFESGWALVDGDTGEKVMGGFQSREAAEVALEKHQKPTEGAQ